MRYTRIYADEAGETHFADAEFQLKEAAYAPPAPPYLVSASLPASSYAVARIPSGWVGDWHPSPRLQLWFQLRGELEVEVSDGETRRFGPGSIVSVEDVSGKGHVTRVLGSEDVHAVYVHLA
ncbi:MAG TPA: hypothetical protein VNN21_02165 [Dehalococcoidia bacterium]|nr:hypothetical protein [Dehalococcoidia bacterium]